MKQTVRALGWATTIFWIILLLFTATAVYSALQIRPGFGEPSVANSDGTLAVSLPLSLYNGGFYDISRFNITTQILDNRGAIITQSSTYVPLIPGGASTTVTHQMSLSIEQAATSNLSYMLFHDSELDVEAVLKLTYANAVPIEISANFTMPWGAPLANLDLGDTTTTPFNITHTRVFIPLIFENHSFFEMNGTALIEIVDNRHRVVGSSIARFIAPPETRFERDIEVLVSGDPAHIREARVYFQTPFFNYGPVVFSLV